MFREISPSETETSPTLRDTIKLPETDNTYIHIEVSETDLAKTFGKFASKQGVNEEDAEKFFKDNVITKFSSADTYLVQDEKDTFHKFLAQIKRITGSAGACVIPEENSEKLQFILDIQKVTEKLPDISDQFLGINNYAELPDEVKIQTFELMLNSITEHEFVHILQAMRSKKDFLARQQKSRAVRDFLIAYTTLGIPTTFTTPEIRAAYSVGIIILGGAALYINKDGIPKLEEEAYKIQFNAIKNNDNVTPFKYTVEKG